MSFAESVTAAQVKKIVAAAVKLPEDKVTVSAKSRRLSDKERRLKSEYDVKMEVADTATAKNVAADVKDAALLQKKAKDLGVTITAPEVSSPALVMDVKYTIMDAVSTPTASQLTNLGTALGAKAEVSNVSTEDAATLSTSKGPMAASSGTR